MVQKQNSISFYQLSTFRINQFHLVSRSGFIHSTHRRHSLVATLFASHSLFQIYSYRTVVEALFTHRVRTSYNWIGELLDVKWCWMQIVSSLELHLFRLTRMLMAVWSSRRLSSFGWTSSTRLAVFTEPILGRKNCARLCFTKHWVVLNCRHWYFTIGLPTVLGIATVPFLFAASETLRNRVVFPERFSLLVSIFFTLVVYSLLPHKEFRFVLPLLPMCLYISADYLSRWSRKTSGWVPFF